METVRWGLEVEFGSGARQVAQRLFSAGLSACNYLHEYHCRCEHCDITGRRGHVNGIMPFHAQADSSCSGEIISRPLRFSEVYTDGLGGRWKAEDFLAKLAQAAVDIDAEPDESAGVHVHISVEDIQGPRLSRGSAVVAFYLWEPFLVRLASGRFARQRQNNASMRQTCLDNGFRLPTAYLSPTHRRNFADLWNDQDRHSNLCTNTRHNTWEFRLWNSTRSAKRLEMYVRVSLALMTPDVYNILKTIDCSVLTWEEQQEVFLRQLDDRTKELVQWQLDYINRRETLDVPAGFRV